MSTKAIRAILNAARHAATENGELEGVREALDAADAEVEAIERACLRIASGHIAWRITEEADEKHVGLLESIGGETAEREAK